MKAANDAFRNSGWANLPTNDRAVFLHRLADLVNQRRDILAQLESLDVGKPLSAALAVDIPALSAHLREFADLSVHLRRREPIAVSGFEARSVRFPSESVDSFPWNFPLVTCQLGNRACVGGGKYCGDQAR